MEKDNIGEIAIDKTEAARPLSLREKMAIYILIVIFRIIVPSKYPHQVDSAMKPLCDLIKENNS